MTKSFFSGRMLCLATISLASTLAAQAHGAMMTFNYSGPVSQIFLDGPDTLDDEFSLGETVNIAFTYDTDAPETILDAQRSTYEDPMLSFSLEFVESGRQFGMMGNAGQIVSVVNDFDNGFGTISDNIGAAAIAAAGDPITGTVNGMTLSILSLSLVDFEDDPTLPDMLSDTSLPATPVEADLAILRFQTNATDAVTVGVNLTIPEPSTLAILVLPLTCFVARRRRAA